MQQEVCSYRLSLRGKPVGTHTLSSYQQGRLAILEGKLMLQGLLGNATVRQQSRLHLNEMVSVSFAEETQERSGKRQFSVTFDKESGLVKATKGKDKSEAPLLLPYLDPLSLLHKLRLSPNENTLCRVPMLGKEVVVERLPDTEFDTPFGKRHTNVYQLHPGKSRVYIDTAEPRHILMLTQPIDGQLVDARLVKVSEETVRQSQNRKSNRSGNRRRRRRRPRKNN